MAKIEENKSYTENKPIQKLLAPQKVYIPLIQHIGKICDQLEVKLQDTVQKGQLLATSKSKVFSPIHSSISGKVTGIENYPHPTLGKCQAIAIENNQQDKSSENKEKITENPDKLSAEEIRNIIFHAGIVGMGGASFPTHIKLNPPKPVNTLIINIAECEPFLTGDSQLAIEKPEEVFLGIQLVAKCLAVKETFLAIEENKPKAIDTLYKYIGKHPFQIRVIKSRYPQGGEKQLIKNILNKEVPRGKLPFDIGVNVQNISTVYAIYEAVYKNKPLYERVVTVTGSCLSNPQNILAPIGTPIKELIQFCSPLKEPPGKIIVGGPMMGIAQYTDIAPVIKSTTGIVVLNEKESKMLEEEFCIRCGACIRECPMALMPCLINLASEKSLWDKTREYGACDCIECGLCNYVCPANRRLVQSIKRAKLEAVK